MGHLLTLRIQDLVSHSAVCGLVTTILSRLLSMQFTGYIVCIVYVLQYSNFTLYGIASVCV